MRSAHVLATFQVWARKNYETCAAIWDAPRVAHCRAVRQRQHAVCWASDKKMLSGAFGDALSEIDCPGAGDSKTKQILLSSLDHLGCGFVAEEDLQWLDKWE